MKYCTSLCVFYCCLIENTWSLATYFSPCRCWLLSLLFIAASLVNGHDDHDATCRHYLLQSPRKKNFGRERERKKTREMGNKKRWRRVKAEERKKSWMVILICQCRWLVLLFLSTEERKKSERRHRLPI